MYLRSRENFPSLSAEEIQKLKLHRPATFHAASQISGVTPHSLVYLFNYVNKRSRMARKAAAPVVDRRSEVVTHHWQEIEDQEGEKGVLSEMERLNKPRAEASSA